MSNSVPWSAAIPSHLRADDVKTSLLGWGGYMTALTCYCMLYQVVVSGVPADLPGSIVRSIREWALWWFVTPLALNALRSYESQRRRILPYLQLAAMMLLVALGYRVALDFLTDDRGVATIVIVFTPRYLAAIAAIFLLWHFFLRRQPPAAADAQPAQQAERPQPAYPETLLVSKGNDKRPVRVERIECVSAAGNYVEIHSERQSYLLRATMKEVEALLPPSQFIRVHRSHIVNLDRIERIRTHRSGSGTVLLRGGKAVSISRQHRTRLQRFKPQV